MEQLTNKEILYEPMKELDDKFPEWMEKECGEDGEEDLKRYKGAAGLCEGIVGRFERKGYSDDNAGDREYIVERMQKVRLPTSLENHGQLLTFVDASSSQDIMYSIRSLDPTKFVIRNSSLCGQLSFWCSKASCARAISPTSLLVVILLLASTKVSNCP